jgi:hypothetical protein
MAEWLIVPEMNQMEADPSNQLALLLLRIPGVLSHDRREHRSETKAVADAVAGHPKPQAP